MFVFEASTWLRETKQYLRREKGTGVKFANIRGWEKAGAADATPKAAQGRGLMAAQKRVAPQLQKLPRSACNKDLERVGGKRSVEG